MKHFYAYLLLLITLLLVCKKNNELQSENSAIREKYNVVLDINEINYNIIKDYDNLFNYLLQEDPEEAEDFLMLKPEYQAIDSLKKQLNFINLK